MASPAWRVEFDRSAARDLRKLGVEAERRVLRYLRERIAGSDDPRRLGHALTATARDSGATALAIIALSLPSRMIGLWCWW